MSAWCFLHHKNDKYQVIWTIYSSINIKFTIYKYSNNYEIGPLFVLELKEGCNNITPQNVVSKLPKLLCFL
jgi:hypothetical protein